MQNVDFADSTVMHLRADAASRAPRDVVVVVREVVDVGVHQELGFEREDRHARWVKRDSLVGAPREDAVRVVVHLRARAGRRQQCERDRYDEDADGGRLERRHLKAEASERTGGKGARTTSVWCRKWRQL